MLLTGIHVEARGPQASSKTIRLCPGLNVVIDPNANANAIGRLLRGTLFGTSRSGDQCRTPQSVDSAGWIEVTSSGQSYRLTRRSFDRRNPLLITPLDPASRPNSLSVLRNLDQETFDAFFSCDFTDQRALESMAVWLHARRDSSSHLQPEAAPLEGSLAVISEEVEQSNLRIRLANARRDLLDRQIIELERRNDRVTPHTPSTLQVAPPEPLARLYERLDEIDCQWRSWRDIQQEIQKRRIGIRDELALAPDVASVPIDHPWHRFRESVQTLETKIASMEPRPKPAHETKSNPNAGMPTQWCDEIRKTLHELNHLLEQQHRQSRHRMAAAELKQLRICYNDLENSVKNMLRRRHSILEQIHALDPQGAELVLQGSQQFCAMAQSEGYWLARQRCLQPVHSTPPPSDSGSEFSIARWQLESARQQRIEVHNQIGREESVLRQWVRQRDEMVDRLCHQRSDVRPFRVQPQAFEMDVRRDIAAPTQILENAAQFLGRLSGGRWVRIGLAEITTAVVVSDAHGRSIDAARLSQGVQSQIAISLCLAVSQHFEDNGRPLPLVLGGLQEIVAADDVRPLLQLVSERCARGQQLVFVACRNHEVAAFAPLRPHVVDLVSSKDASLERVPPMALADSHTFRERAPGHAAHPWQPVDHLRMGSDNEGQLSGELIYRFPIQRDLRWQDHTGRTSGTQDLSMSHQHTSGASGTKGSVAHGSGLPPKEFGRESNTVSRTSHLRDAGVCTFAELSALERFGVTTIGKLLDANPESLAEALSDVPALSTQVRRWQACCWMLVCVPEMAAEDAQVLYECGITVPQQLEEVRGEFLLSKLQSHLTASGRGSAFARYDVERINGWMRSLARTRPQWKQLAGSSGHSPRSSNENSRESLRFHLHLNDSVDAAPSIGSRVFQQLGQIGVRTVRDFLSRGAEDVAREMNNRRITAETIRQWQQQARIACSVPNLRRHDAQILVACGMDDPEKIATMAPAKLFAQVDQFLRSKTGMRLIRSGKKPDLAEVTDWIRWARHTRSVQAA